MSSVYRSIYRRLISVFHNLYVSPNRVVLVKDGEHTSPDLSELRTCVKTAQKLLENIKHHCTDELRAINVSHQCKTKKEPSAGCLNSLTKSLKSSAGDKLAVKNRTVAALTGSLGFSVGNLFSQRIAVMSLLSKGHYFQICSPENVPLLTRDLLDKYPDLDLTHFKEIPLDIFPYRDFIFIFFPKNPCREFFRPETYRKSISS